MITPNGVVWGLVLLAYCSLTCYGGLTEINDFLKEYNKEGDDIQYNETLAAWNYEVRIIVQMLHILSKRKFDFIY